MSMTANAAIAFAKLKSSGVPVREWGKPEGYGTYAQFVIIGDSRDGDEVFADFDQGRLKEAFVNGVWVNPIGIRQDIHEVLAEHNLATDWISFGQVVVYDADEHEVAGYHHKATLGNRTTKQTTPEMSPAAFKAFLALARIGAPVEDWHYRLNRDPALLPPGTQFVMQKRSGIRGDYADAIDSEGSRYAETSGLRLDVFKIATANGLRHQYFVRKPDDDRFPIEDLIAFIDPTAPSRQ